MTGLGPKRARAAFVASASVALLGLAACGSEQPVGRTSQPPPTPKPAETDLVVSVTAPEATTHRVRCPGSDECGRLGDVTVSDFKRGTRRVCAQHYGGDWTASIRGTLHSERFATDFSLRDGCEISRWQRFSWLLGKKLPRAVTG